MFAFLGKSFLTGIITLLPLVLTVYLLYWLGVTSEQVMGNALQTLVPETIYFPGLGMLTGIGLVLIVGLLMNAYLVRKLFELSEKALYKLPLIRTIYSAFRDFFDFFSPKKKGLGQVVAVSLNGMELVGFITQEDPQRLPASFRDRDSVLVYLPMSYMVGGYTLLIKHSDLRPLKMSRDEAMRFVLTAGITGKKID